MLAAAAAAATAHTSTHTHAQTHMHNRTHARTHFTHSSQIMHTTTEYNSIIFERGQCQCLRMQCLNFNPAKTQAHSMHAGDWLQPGARAEWPPKTTNSSPLPYLSLQGTLAGDRLRSTAHSTERSVLPTDKSTPRGPPPPPAAAEGASSLPVAL